MEKVQDVMRDCFARSTCLDEKRHETEILKVEIKLIVQRITVGLRERVRSDQSRGDAEWGHNRVFLAVLPTKSCSAMSNSC